MRKIEQDIINAIKAKQSKNFSNTSVQVDGSGTISVYLHDNLIALIEDDVVYLSSCGWYTPTTKGRLNCVLDALGINKGVFQKKGIWYVWDRDTDENITFVDNIGFSYK